MIRLSGEGLLTVLGGFCERMRGGPVKPGRALRVRLFDEAGVFDDGIVIYQRGPNTYTGEDTAEISCHGNPLIVERLIAAACSSGARLAQAGEFTRLAVLHGKIDLLGAGDRKSVV